MQPLDMILKDLSVGHSLLTACSPSVCLPGQNVPRDSGPRNVFDSDPVWPSLLPGACHLAVMPHLLFA